MTLKLEVVEPSDSRTLERFIRVAERINAGDPAYVAPLRFERRDALSPTKNPFFRHAEARYWLASRDGRDVGRISAQVDRLQREPVGHFGLIAAEDDAEVFAALTGVSEAWLRARGHREALGPFNLSVNEEVGLLVDGFDMPPMMMMGHDPRYAGRRLEAQGYIGVKDVHAWRFPVDASFSAPVERRLARGLPPGVRLRGPDMRRLGDEVALMADIVNDAWSDNWGFVAWTAEETRHLAESLKALIDPRVVFFVEVDGQAAGFIVCLPDLNQAIAGLGGRLLPFGWAKLLWRLKVKGVTNVRVPLMGVRKAFARRPGGAMLPFILMDASLKAGRRAGYRMVEASWILEDNRAMRHILEGLGAEIVKTYRLYRKAL